MQPIKINIKKVPKSVHYPYYKMSKLHTDSTSAAQHKTQGKRKADRWKIDCERRREEHKTLLRFPSPKSLNYYLLLFYYFNNVHLCGPITYKSLLGLACAHNTFTGIPVNVLLPVIPHMREYT